MSQKHILVVNSGSSSVKLGVFEGDKRLFKGTFERVGAQSCSHRIEDDQGGVLSEGSVPSESAVPSYSDCIKFFVARLCELGVRFDAVGHRVVHGGLSFEQPVLIDDEAFESLRRLEPLAPLHQPYNLAGVKACAEALPGIPQIACFDTAFHSGRPIETRRYAIPHRFAEKGVMAYGFHGLSYEHVSSKFEEAFGHRKRSKVVVCHLGNGSSVCAVQDGKGVSSSMGFTALEGVPMGTRCGNLDPGVLLYLLQQEGMTPDELADVLYKKSGLLGVSELSSDVRDLEKAAADGHEGALRALALFCERIAEQVLKMAQAMRGIEGLVFTAGIGENSALVREMVCSKLEWLGLRLDPKANAEHQTIVSYPSSSLTVCVIPTDEEGVIARHADRLAFA